MSGTDSATAEKPPPPGLPAGLYVVATPIGNLGDITVRALDVLRAADAIACEDSRVTAKLLSAYRITTSMMPYHEHNATKVRPRILRRLAEGDRIALVSDAGTPLVSDPGFKLVRAARAAGINVTALPGASALLAALCSAGLPTNAFHFAGFLPPRTAARRKALAALREIAATLVLYESPARLGALLDDAADVLGPRPAAVCRELTKLHEETVTEDLATLARRYRDTPPRGEIVVVIGPPADGATSPDDLDARLAEALAHHSLRDAVDGVAADTGAPRKQVYSRALALQRARPDERA